MSTATIPETALAAEGVSSSALAESLKSPQLPPSANVPAKTTTKVAANVPKQTATATATDAVKKDAADAKAAPEPTAAKTAPAAEAVPASETKSDDAAVKAEPTSLLAELEAQTDQADEGPADSKPAEIRYDLKAPEKSGLTEADLTEIETVARANKITPEAAQALVEWKAKDRAAAQAKVDAIASDWKKAITADPKIGGKQWKETVTLVDRALTNEPALRDVLAKTPFRYHPAVVEYLARQGAKTVEDRQPVGGTPPPSTKPHDPARWFPNSKH